MTVLLIGGGVVGSQIARILLEQGRAPVLMDSSPQLDALADNVDVGSLTVVRGDILDPFDLARAIRDNGVTQVIHTAAYPMLTQGAQQNPYGAIRINIMGTANVLEAARAFGVERAVVVSSVVLSSQVEGGEDGGDAFKEEAFPRPGTFYSATKQAVESLAHNYAKWCGLDARVVRYAAVAGPWRRSGGGGLTVVFRDLVVAALETGEVTVPARPMEWVYSKDAARGTVLALDAEDLKSRVFNIGGGRVTNGDDLVRAFGEALPQVKVRVSEAADAAGGGVRRDRSVDLTRARAALGYEPQFDLTAAIKDYAEWYRALKARGGSLG